LFIQRRSGGICCSPPKSQLKERTEYFLNVGDSPWIRFHPGMDDVSEVYAVNAQSGNGTIVGRVCAGVPLDRFRWLQ
jgi:hypothetical protein